MAEQDKVEEVPVCPHCGNTMIWLLGFANKEWACIPCAHGESMYNSLPTVFRTKRSLQAKRRRWQRDIHAYALQHSDAKCTAVGADGKCKYGCPVPANYQYRYLGKRKRPIQAEAQK